MRTPCRSPNASAYAPIMMNATVEPNTGELYKMRQETSKRGCSRIPEDKKPGGEMKNVSTAMANCAT